MERKKINKSVLVYDYGLFTCLAKTLSQYFEKVYYYYPCRSKYPKYNEKYVGTGFTEFEVVESFANVKDNVDLFIFPDIYDGDIQLELEAEGKLVWGSRMSEELEIYRWEFRKFLEEVGLPTIPAVLIKGTDKLKEHLKDKENKWIKLAVQMRGTSDTFHYINQKLSEPLIDELALKLGAIRNDVEFVVEDNVEADEVGYDGYCINGKFPPIGWQGVEVKEKAYFGSARRYNNLDKNVKFVNEKIASELEKYEHKGNISTEIRVTKKESFFIDATQRFAFPPTLALFESISNLGEILIEGAAGNIVAQELEGQYIVQANIFSEWAEDHWLPVYFPKEIDRYVKLFNSCKIDGVYNIIPMTEKWAMIGCVVANGKTPEEAIKKCKEYASKIDGIGIDIKTDAIDEAYEIFKKRKL